MSATRRLNDPKYLQLHIPGNGHVQDTSGHGNHGTWTGTATYTPGAFSGHDAILLDGSKYVTTETPVVDGVSAFSASCFAYGISYRDVLFGNTNASDSTGFNIYGYASDVLYYRIAGTTTTWSGARDTASWYHYLLAFSGIAATLYIDGLARAWMNATGVASVTPFRIGAYANGTLGWVGGIGHVRLYSCCLTGDEVAALYDWDRR